MIYVLYNHVLYNIYIYDNKYTGMLLELVFFKKTRDNPPKIPANVVYPPVEGGR